MITRKGAQPVHFSHSAGSGYLRARTLAKDDFECSGSGYNPCNGGVARDDAVAYSQESIKADPFGEALRSSSRSMDLLQTASILSAQTTEFTYGECI